MNPAKLISFLNNPALITSADIIELEQITKEFPYFNLPYIVLAKAYKEEESYKYSTILPVASVHSKNRGFLYNYIHDSKIVDEEVVNKKEPTKIEKADKKKQKITIDIEKPLVEVTLNEEIKPKIELKEVVIKPKVDLYNLQESVNNIKEISAKTDEELTFSQWLEMGSESKKSIVKEENTKPAKNTISLIDKFLQDKPRISRPKKKFYKAADFAKRSDTLGDELLTETLAKILAKQGEYAKAIEVYDKLIVKFPLKRIYFAALKQKIIEKNV